MKTFKELTEARKSTIVMAFGRLNPPTKGHEVLANAIMMLAKKHNADHVFYLSRSQDPKKNPLTIEQKVYYARQSFKGMNIVGANDHVRSFIEVAKDLNGKYSDLIVVAGSDRVLEFKTLLDKYNGKDYSFDSILVVSAGDRDPDAQGAAGMSATKMRAAAASNDFARFRLGCPTKMNPVVAKKMFDDLRSGMKLTENNDVREEYINERIFNVGDIVLFKEQELAIKSRGSNYVVLENDQRVWLSDIKPTEKVDESMQVKQQDKLKAARIIGMALGYMDSNVKSDPTSIVNTALRGIRNKTLNDESKKIIGRMLDLAKTMEIQYDDKLLGLEEQAVLKDGAHVTPEDKERSNLMIGVDKALETEYSRRRKIQLKVHESDEQDLDDDNEIDDDSIIDSICDDDIIEHGYDDEEFHIVDDETGEIIESFELEALQEVLSRIERMRSKMRFKKSQGKRERAEKIALKRRSSADVIAKRARRVAVKAIELRIAKKPLNQLSLAEKERVEARIAKMKPAIARIAARMISKVRAVEKNRLEHHSTER